MAKKRKKKAPGLFARLFDAILSFIDWLCETIADTVIALLNVLLALVRLILLGLWRAVCLLVHLLTLPFVLLWRHANGSHRRAEQCLRLTGEEFEQYVALLLKDHYYRRIELTKGSGDQGVDILCERNGKTYAIQCKNYEGAVGNFAVQEAYAGAEFYGCDVPVVICPGTFTRGAIELADSTGVELWDGERLSRMMKKSGRKPRHQKA